MTFVSSKAASTAVEELKLFKEGLTVKLDFNVGQWWFISVWFKFYQINLSFVFFRSVFALCV